jgi:hypothetical protein
MNDLPVAFPFVLLLLAPAGWCVALLAVSILSGWSELAPRFPRNSEPLGPVYASGSWFNLVYLRNWCKYSGAINFEAAEDALYLNAIPLFRPFHPPLRIPWSEIRISSSTYLFKDFLVLTLGNAEQIPLRISSGLARDLGLYNRLCVPQAG